jgi:hypothetical protein
VDEIGVVAPTIRRNVSATVSATSRLGIRKRKIATTFRSPPLGQKRRQRLRHQKSLQQSLGLHQLDRPPPYVRSESRHLGKQS